MPPRVVTLLLLLAIAALLALTWPLDLIHFDSTRDLLMARDCYALGRCDGHGPPTSVAGLFQGVLWTNALALARAIGLMPRAIGLALIGFYLLVLAATARRFRAEGPLLLLWLGVGSSLLVPVVLWSPTLFLPAMILTTWLTLAWLEQPRWPLALGLGVLWGVTLDLYLAAGPVLVAACALGLRARKKWQVLGIVALALGVGLLVSPGAWASTLAVLRQFPLTGAVGAALLALVLLVVPSVPRLDSLALLTLAGLAAWLVVGVAHHFESRYLLPGFPAACLLLARRWPRGRVAEVVGWLLPILAVQQTFPHFDRHLTYTHAAQLAEAMQVHGTGWPQALAHAQGDFSRELAPATAVFLPLAPTRWQGEDVVVDLDHAPSFRAVPSRVDLSRADFCTWPGPVGHCQLLEMDATPHNSLFPFALRSYDAILRPLPRAVQRVTLRVPIRAGARETLQLLPLFHGDACPWTLVGAVAQVTLARDATELVWERRVARNGCPEGQLSADWLPPWLETPLEPATPQPPPVLPTAIRQPVLARASEAQFGQLAATLATRLHTPEPDIALGRDCARILWPGQAPVELRYAPQPPWLHAVQPPTDATHAAALAEVLPQVFTANPWQDAQTPVATQTFSPEQAQPPLALAGLGLLVLLGAAWRVAR